MSRVHDALRRAEQAGVLNLESGNAPAAPPPVLDHQGPARATENGAARVAVEDFAPGGLHPVILENVPEVAFQPAPESHLLDLQRSHETPARVGRQLQIGRGLRAWWTAPGHPGKCAGSCLPPRAGVAPARSATFA